MNVLVEIPWHVYVSILAFSITVGVLVAIELRDLLAADDHGATVDDEPVARREAS